MALKLRQSQFVEISNAHRPDRIERYRLHLRTCFGPGLAGLDDEQLRASVGATLDRAHAAGLRAPLDELRFLNLAACFGWRFDEEHPWVGPMLRDRSVRTPSERLLRVKARFVRQLQLERVNAESRRAFDSAR